MARPFVSLSLTVLAAASLLAPASRSSAAPSSTATQSVANSEPWSGDFDGMLARRRIRMLVPYSRSLFYVENGQEHGLTADLAHDFESYLNRKHAAELGADTITVTLIPTTRDKLLGELVAGKGDISGGNLTATSRRMVTVEFVVPTDQAPAKEVLVSGPNSPRVDSLTELSGKHVNVRRSSSYQESLDALNRNLGAGGKPGVQVVTMPEALEDEDLLEMLNAGLFDFVVVDSWKANLWAVSLPKIVVHNDVVLRNGGTIGWAIRRQSPKLEAEIQGFYQTANRQGLIEARLSSYRDRLREMSQGAQGQTPTHFEQTLDLFRKYGNEYPFDPLMLAAEGYHEGGGLAAPDSQAPPVSAEDLKNNIQAARKYISQLMTRAFPDAKFSDLDRTLFIFASYKAGSQKIASLRQEAARQGLDPDQWFNNVELVTAEKLGMETTAYVRNILKYNVASKIVMEAAAPKN